MKVLIVLIAVNWWYDSNTDANKKLSPIATELFLRGRKLNILPIFISQSCFKVPETIRLNVTDTVFCHENTKIRITPTDMPPNHSSEIEFKDFMELSRDYFKELFSFLMSNTPLPSENPLRFRKNLLQNDW